MTMIVAAALLLSPVGTSSVMDVGSAAYYAPSYDYGGWDAIIAVHARAGQIDRSTFPYSRAGYWCVQPDHDLGDRLRVVNAMTGATIVCTVADTVAPRDEPHWRQSVVIELSYRAFVAADGHVFNRFVVTDAEAG